MAPTPDPDALKELAQAACEHQLTHRPPRVQFGPPPPVVRIGAAILDIILFMPIAFCCTLSIILGDFDGPAQREAIGEWLFCSGMSASAIAYLCLDVIGRTPGKLIMNVRVISLCGSIGARMLRITLKVAPLILMLIVGLVGFIHTAWQSNAAFTRSGWNSDWVPSALPIILIAMWISASLMFGPDQQTWYDLIACTAVVSPGIRHRARGFEPVMPVPPNAGKAPPSQPSPQTSFPDADQL